MTGARFTATLDDAKFEAGLKQLLGLMRNTTPMMRAIGVRLAASTEDRLGGTTAPDGSPWAALNPAYAAIKRQPGMLKERGAQGGLLASITYLASHNQVVVGSNKIYAAIHQFGGKIVPKNAKALVFHLGAGHGIVRVKSVTIPARPYLGISAADEAKILGIVDGFYTRALSGA
jgi:phage virion morphogenesis protein